MQDQYNMVIEFHQTFGHPVRTKLDATLIENLDLVNFRINLIEEEIKEFQKAELDNDKKEMLDALCDIQYVLYGAQIVLGIPIEFERSNDLVSFDEALFRLKMARDDKSFSDFWSALMDVQTCLENTITRCNWSNIFNLAFEEVHKSNMTKACLSKKQALLDKDYREKEMGIKVIIEKIGNYWVLKNKETTKVVKAVNWRNPNFDELLK